MVHRNKRLAGDKCPTSIISLEKILALEQPSVQNITFTLVTAPVSGGASTVVDYIQELMSESVASFKTCFTIKHIYYSKSYRIPCPFKIKKTITAFFEARKLLSSRPQSFEMVCIRNIAMKSFETIRNSRVNISPIAPMKRIIGRIGISKT